MPAARRAERNPWEGVRARIASAPRGAEEAVPRGGQADEWHPPITHGPPEAGRGTWRGKHPAGPSACVRAPRYATASQPMTRSDIRRHWRRSRRDCRACAQPSLSPVTRRPENRRPQERVCWRATLPRCLWPVVLFYGSPFHCSPALRDRRGGLVVRPARLELATFGFEVRDSIH